MVLLLPIILTTFLAKIETPPPVNHEAVSENFSSLPDLGAAPDFTGIDGWINSEPLSINQLRGKVVLVDFWTYSCINCLRTLPHVNGWYDKYKDQGFVVVGVHTPEFDFEKDTKNIQQAIKRFDIHYPVAEDSNSQTWKAYDNHYWPAKYLIDVNGHIRYTHFGEGKYDEMELVIRQLLKEAGQVIDGNLNVLENHPSQIMAGFRTPETYLGKARIERFASNERISGGSQIFTLPSRILQDNFAYQGVWDISDESAQAQKGSALEIRFKADKVFLVISPRQKGNRIKIFLDGKRVDASVTGEDVQNGEIILDEERLYSLIDLKGKAGSHHLRLEFEDEGIVVYAFTFG